MLNLAWPWLLLCLPLPWLARRWLPARDERQLAALRVPFLYRLKPPSGRQTGAADQRRLWLAMLAWLLLVLAASRPQWLGDAIEVPVTGRDLMLAVDLSGSMEETDFLLNDRQVDRLTATQAVAGEFIRRRIGDRIGLILFGEQAYLQTPLTFDRDTVNQLLQESAIGLAGQKTAIGDAIGLAVKRLREYPDKDRVLILLTDGANTAGEVEPLRAADLARASGLRIHTIGIGADEMLVRSLFGTRRVRPSTELDEQTLTGIAKLTGGQYFRARDTAELERIYALLDELEPVERDQQYYRPRISLYPWPLALALLLGAIAALWPVLPMRIQEQAQQ